ncbi:MAG: threonine/serine exporter family protein [Clostridia bacterium]|nr:threonine/serine exporter family protein [Clostridia bacterium]
MTDIIVRLITALLGTLGFAIMFRVSRSRLPWAALGGLLTYAVYELFWQLLGDPLISAFASSLFMALYSEALARILHAPTIIFLFPCAIPIVPGGGLYYTVYNLLFWNEAEFVRNAKSTASIVLGMAVGVSVASIIIGGVLQAAGALRKMREK